MSNTVPELVVWTEGLDEDWQRLPGNRERVSHGSMSAAALEQEVENLFFKYEDLSDCLIVVDSGLKTLNIAFDMGTMEISDPNDLRYHHIGLDKDRLPEILEEIIRKDDSEEEPHAGIPPMLEWGVALVSVIALVGAVIFASNSLKRDSGFMPYPVAVKIENPIEAQHAKQQWAGIYTTGIDDGEMLIELQKSGLWAYYDLVKNSSRSYQLVRLGSGNFNPALEGATMAILTDNRFVFYPVESGSLEFLQREFKRTANTREDLPFLNFPEIPEEAGK